ncbi:hypothetical protein EUA76_02375 [TM7 phylum sp. oral taxon 350]|nr:hypothetical protein EUA76_02375 [TM7 phylum sp. oral taxon 350]
MKKKRNKKYQGSKVVKPTTIKITAKNRSFISLWWKEKKVALKPMLSLFLIILILAVLIFEIIKIAIN